MVASDSFAEFLREQLAPPGRVTMRRMFGKTGVFCNGMMFGMVTDNMLYLRVDDHNRAAFKEAESFPPLSYEKKGCTIDLAFWRAPERLFDEPDELVTWARIALAAARRVAAEERTDSASGKIKAAIHTVARLSLIHRALTARRSLIPAAGQMAASGGLATVRLWPRCRDCGHSRDYREGGFVRMVLKRGPLSATAGARQT
jgi:DNA transformation protein and related proteins